MIDVIEQKKSMILFFFGFPFRVYKSKYFQRELSCSFLMINRKINNLKFCFSLLRLLVGNFQLRLRKQKFCNLYFNIT